MDKPNWYQTAANYINAENMPMVHGSPPLKLPTVRYNTAS